MASSSETGPQHEREAPKTIDDLRAARDAYLAGDISEKAWEEAWGAYHAQLPGRSWPGRSPESWPATAPKGTGPRHREAGS